MNVRENLEVIPFSNRDPVFERVAYPHRRALYNYALKMLRNPDDADDLVQETYYRAYKFFHHFELGSNCKAWLFKILKNSLINHYRKECRQPKTIDYEEVFDVYERMNPQDVKSEHEEFDEIMYKTFDDDLTEAISFLPEDFRTVILLGDIENYTYEEIADFVDCPVGTVRSRLHRARKMLYSKLYNYARVRGYVPCHETRINA